MDGSLKADEIWRHTLPRALLHATKPSAAPAALATNTGLQSCPFAALLPSPTHALGVPEASARDMHMQFSSKRELHTTDMGTNIKRYLLYHQPRCTHSMLYMHTTVNT